MRPPALTHPSAAVFLGDCLDVLAEMPDDSIDAIVTDPPYGLGFMGKAWDDLPPGLDWAVECLRVLKPGGHLLAFGGSRTWHRLAVAVEDAGFEVRDSIAWLYGSGFPKSLDVSKAIDKAAGATREVVGDSPFAARKPNGSAGVTSVGLSATPGAQITTPATPAAQQWQGWGTALKPAFEPIVVARKPLIGTVAANVLAHGTGALNVDGCRVESDDNLVRPASYPGSFTRDYQAGQGKRPNGQPWGREGDPIQGAQPAGRWPTNVVLDGDAAAELDEQSGTLTSGGASRFFPVFRYQAKAPTRERPTYVKEDGDAGFQATSYGQMKTRECNVCGSRAKAAGGDQSGRPWPTCGHEDWAWVEQQKAESTGTKVAHPTVKPLALMRWLTRLVAPAGGTVLDTFAGSGATIEAAVEEGFYALGIEREETYLPLIQIRLDRATVPAPDTDS